MTVLLNVAVLAAYGVIVFADDSRIILPLIVMVFLAAGNSVYWSWKRFVGAGAATRKKMGLLHVVWYAMLVLCFVLIAWRKISRH